MSVMSTTAPTLTRVANPWGTILPVGVIIAIAVIVVPLPTPILDLLITIDLAVSIVVLMTAMYVPGPTKFSAFPSLILLITLFRLSLNIAATRLILLQGHTGTHGAGVVVESFGQFVVGGSYVVGIVIFVVLLVVQFVVISHGSTRISEVIARFTLDAMPGKQMAIDADLNAGLITEREAIARRAQIQKEAEFFGAMDGAVRFTQRDAIAALVIVVVNIVGGLAIGIFQRGMSPREALSTYTLLTIGEGLVAAIPALLMATSTGIITTRAAQENNLGDEVVNQLLFSPKPLKIAAGTLAVLALIPGLPKVSFLLLAAATFGAARVATARQAEAQAAAVIEATASKPEPVDDEFDGLMQVDPLCIEVGYDLIAAIGADRSGGILDKIKGLRRQLAGELGFVLPPVRVRDNLQLPPDQYGLLLRGVKIGGGRVPRGRLLAIEAGVTRSIEGEKTSDPAFGLPAVWISHERADEARSAGYTVVDPPSVISTHLMETIQRHAADLLGREDTARLLDTLQKSMPKAVAELVPERMTVGEVQRVLQGLLRESVPIRDLPLIVEALADTAPATRDQTSLIEAVRRALGRTIALRLTDERGVLKAVALDAALEDELTRALIGTAPDRGGDGISAARAREIVSRVSSAIASTGGGTAIVVSPKLRPAFALLLRAHLPHTQVLSTLEIPPEVTLRAVATVA